jgi:hypothetical protein
MHHIFGRTSGIAALSAIALILGSCGESSEEKATKQVCSATSEISTQIQKLQTLSISSSFPAEVKTSAEAIDKSVNEIESAAPNLPTARKEEFSAATDTFKRELTSLLVTTASSAVSGEASLKNAEAKIKSSLDKLAGDYKQAFEALKCP